MKFDKTKLQHIIFLAKNKTRPDGQLRMRQLRFDESVTDRQTNRPTNGPTDQRTDRRTDGQTLL